MSGYELWTISSGPGRATDRFKRKSGQSKVDCGVGCREGSFSIYWRLKAGMWSWALIKKL